MIFHLVQMAYHARKTDRVSVFDAFFHFKNKKWQKNGGCELTKWQFGDWELAIQGQEG